MQSVMQNRAFSAGASARPASRAIPRVACKRVGRSARAQRRGAVEVQAFFNFFTPKPAAAVPSADDRAKPLVEDLIQLTAFTDAGAKCSPEQKEQIAETVIELSRYCMKNPLKSDLLFGEWQVLFSSKPSAVGGPLRKGPGPAVFPGQEARQIISAPNKLVNVVEYKTLGFLPGSNRQFGTIEPISGDTFILNITSGEVQAGVGGAIKKDFDIKRKIKILYLDDQIRVAQFLPSDLQDSERDENGGGDSEDIVFVFQRVNAPAEEDEPKAAAPKAAPRAAPKPAPRRVVVEEDEDEEEEEKPAFTRISSPFGAFGGSRKLESPATVAERQVREQLQRGGTAKLPTPPPSPTRKLAPPAPAVVTRSGSAKVAAAPGTQKGKPVPVEDPREARRRQQEEERARKAAEAEARAAEAKKSAAAKEAEAKKIAAQKEVEKKKAEAEAKKVAALKEAEAKKAAAAKEAEAKRIAAQKEAEAKKQAAIRELLADLAEEIKERTAAARDALKELKDIERSAAAGLKEVSGARSKVEEAESDVKSVQDALDAALAKRNAAAKDAQAAKDVVVAAEKALRTVVTGKK
ncbi:hypothetical protein HYH03_008513 [Edaphochlamys debaryana]|uniref:Plastid lipid-associated protein/fibrillin conserved domain-containing protein n=1 Tax=Edaphochlamys debaryana TaxID=47281 RepID=A0A835Y018_9CHLO|nr:hypothetical protein HYH03_008513 [Edaphochlamys debaryana]|eukprot:KAG2493381.1 hypothetical protein HYH03_008513 [Edaphochlamys debaryana]